MLQRGKQRIELGQGGAVGRLEGFDGLDAGGEGLLEGEWGYGNKCLTYVLQMQIWSPDSLQMRTELTFWMPAYADDREHPFR